MKEIWQEWLEKQKSSTNGKQKKYIHFDRQILLYQANGVPNSNIIKKLENAFLTNAAKSITPHPFYPFIFFEINSKKYKFDNAKDKGIYKPKSRPISYASHFDSLIFSWYSHLIGHKYESKLIDLSLSPNIIAYRSIDSKSTIDFAKEVFDFIVSNDNVGVIALDITGFFDNINHQILKEAISFILDEERLPNDIFSVYKAITKYSIIEKDYLLDEFGRTSKKSNRRYFRNNDRICSPKQLRTFIKKFPESIFKNLKNKGIPQGSPISALFSNISLIKFDEYVSHLVRSQNGLYRRYSDDIIVVVPRDKVKDIKTQITNKIETINLKINEKKTEINYFNKTEEGKLICENSKGQKSKVQYLGFDFDGLDVRIRSSSISRYYKKVRMTSKKIVSDLYSYNNVSNQIFKKEFYSRYSTRGLKNGRNNFIGYMKLANSKINSNGIKKQLSIHFKKINQILNEEIKREKNKIIEFIEKKSP